jgi:transcriptional regulator of acetoin/glycerol metabolism
MAAKFGRLITSIDPTVIKCLENYDWPGNIRELQNVVERILLVAEDGHITIDYLPREIVDGAIGYPRDKRERGHNPAIGGTGCSDRNTRRFYVIEQEKESIMRALDVYAGNISKASDELGISRNTLYRKMKTYSITN